MTTILCPNKGSFSYQLSFSRSLTTSLHDDRRGQLERVQADQFRQAFECAREYLLVGASTPADRHRGRSRRAASVNNAPGDFVEVRKPHEDDESFGCADFRPIDLQHIMAGNKGDDRCVIAMRERDASAV